MSEDTRIRQEEIPVACGYCKKIVSEETANRTRAGKFACDECYDPNDREQQGRPNYLELKRNNADIVENTAKATQKNFTYTSSQSEVYKDKEKAIEISNVEELNAQV